MSVLLRNRYLYLPILFATLLLSCASNPVATAQTPEQKAGALYGIYVIAKENGVAILNDATVPDSIKRPIALAMVASSVPAKALYDAMTQKKDLTLPIANAQPMIDDLVTKVAGAKP
jgi:hypothetical protein